MVQVRTGLVALIRPSATFSRPAGEAVKATGAIGFALQVLPGVVTGMVCQWYQQLQELPMGPESPNSLTGLRLV